MSLPVNVHRTRRTLSLVGASLVVVISVGYARRATSQTPAPAKPLTLAGLAARIAALESENRTLRERITRMEQPQIVVPFSSRGQTPEGSALYGPSPYPYLLSQPGITVHPWTNLPLTLPEIGAQRFYNSSPQGPPPRIFDSREVPGLMLLRGGAEGKP